jgi:hypothetical protein
LAVAGAYIVVFPYYPAINNPNENVRVYAARALAEHGTFAIDRVIAEWGDVGDRAAAGGNRYSSKAPGTSLVGAPIHFVHARARALLGLPPPSRAAVTWALRVFGVAIPLALFLLWFSRRVEAESGSPFARDLLTVGLGLGTLLYPTGVLFVGHALAAALLFGGFALARGGGGGGRGAEPAPPPEPRRLAVAGLLAGLAVAFEYQTLVGAVVVAVYAAAVHRRRVWLFAAGAAVPALLLGAYHAALFGRPWSLPYAHLDDPAFQYAHHGTGFLGFGRPVAAVILQALVSLDYGLFVFSPFLALGLGVALAETVRRGRAEQAAALAVTAVLIVFLSGLANWRGGWCAGGPRYIAPVAVFLTWPLALAWRDAFAARPRLRLGFETTVAGLVIAGVVLCGLSGAVFPHYPLQFDNPVFDLTVRLVREGVSVPGLGRALGLSGAATLLPFAAAAVAATALALRGARAPVRTAAGALALALAVLAVLGALKRGPDREEDRTVEFVRGVMGAGA